jgi:hypothetical protein
MYLRKRFSRTRYIPHTSILLSYFILIFGLIKNTLNKSVRFRPLDGLNSIETVSVFNSSKSLGDLRYRLYLRTVTTNENGTGL